MVKNLPEKQETWGWSLGWEDPLEEHVATHSRILAWRIPWAEEPGGLQSMGSHRVGHNWVTNTHTHTHRNKDKANILLPPPQPQTLKRNDCSPQRLEVWWREAMPLCPILLVAGGRGLAGAGQRLTQSLGLVRGKSCEGSPALGPLSSLWAGSMKDGSCARSHVYHLQGLHLTPCFLPKVSSQALGVFWACV